MEIDMGDSKKQSMRSLKWTKSDASSSNFQNEVTRLCVCLCQIQTKDDNDKKPSVHGYKLVLLESFQRKLKSNTSLEISIYLFDELMMPHKKRQLIHSIKSDYATAKYCTES